MGRRDSANKGVCGSGACMCFAFIMALFATASPYWLYANSYPIFGGTRSTIATGSYVLSSSSSAWQCGLFTTCSVYAQWNYFDDFNNTLCLDTGSTPTNYQLIGKYGFCDAPNGNFQTPKQISQIQALSIATTVLAFFGAILAMSTTRSGTAGGGVASIVCLATTCTSCAAFSVAVSYDYYQTFWGEGNLPFIGQSSGKDYVFIQQNLRLYWGPAFWMMVTTFVISLSTTVSIAALSKDLDDDDLDGEYGSGAAEADYEAQDFGYGVAKA